jgi:hypothetical protein
LQDIDFSKQYLTIKRIIAVQEHLLGFINVEVIELIERLHVAKFVIGEESPPPPSPPRKRNAPTKNQRGSDFSVHKNSK